LFGYQPRLKKIINITLFLILFSLIKYFYISQIIYWHKCHIICSSWISTRLHQQKTTTFNSTPFNEQSLVSTTMIKHHSFSSLCCFLVLSCCCNRSCFWRFQDFQGCIVFSNLSLIYNTLLIFLISCFSVFFNTDLSYVHVIFGWNWICWVVSISLLTPLKRARRSDTTSENSKF